MFLSFSKKTVLIFIAISVSFFSFGFLLSIISKEQTVASPYNITIVLDAGHGGLDGGSIGNNGTVEAELNLVYVNKLEKLFKSANINVVKTRKSPDFPILLQPWKISSNLFCSTNSYQSGYPYF